MKQFRYLLKNLPLLLLQSITRHPRYRPQDYELNGKMNWSSKVWVSNIFRFYELIFGRGFGIRAEASSSIEEVDGKIVVNYEFYSVEALLSHIEVTIRGYFAMFFSSQGKVIDYRPVYLTLGILGIFISIKTKVNLLPFFGLAIALDTTSSGTATTTTPIVLSHTCTGSNLIIIIAGFVTAAAATLSTPTYNSVTSTAVHAPVSNGGSILIGLWFNLGPATGAHNISMGFGGTGPTANVGGLSWSGVAQSGQPDASNSAASQLSANGSITVTTSADNCWVAGDCGGGTAPTANLTSRAALAFSTSNGNLQDTNGVKHPAGAQAVGWTFGSQFWGAIAASFSPAAASTPYAWQSSINQPFIANDIQQV